MTTFAATILALATIAHTASASAAGRPPGASRVGVPPSSIQATTQRPVFSHQQRVHLRCGLGQLSGKPCGLKP